MVLFRSRRSGRAPDDPRIVAWQVGVFFLAAGVWLAGVVADDGRLTGAALAVLLLGLALRLLRDRGAADDVADADDEAWDDGDEPEPGPR